MSWKVHIDDDWSYMSKRVVLHRRMEGGHDVVVGFDDEGFPEIRRVETGASTEGLGLFLAPEMLDALAEAGHPGPSQAEMNRVLEALEVERTRVDRIIGGAHSDR